LLVREPIFEGTRDALSRMAAAAEASAPRNRARTAESLANSPAEAEVADRLIASPPAVQRFGTTAGGPLGTGLLDNFQNRAAEIIISQGLRPAADRHAVGLRNLFGADRTERARPMVRVSVSLAAAGRRSRPAASFSRHLRPVSHATCTSKQAQEDVSRRELRTAFRLA
jgi:hypothetical protein